MAQPNRLPPPSAIYWRVGLLISLAVFGPLLVFVVAPIQRLEFLVIGGAYGTLIQHSVLAAAWCAFGPATLWWRLPLSVVWTCVVSLGVVLPLIWDMNFNNWEPLIAVPVMVGIWFLVQVPLWGVALLFGLRLRYQGMPAVETQRERQFGIRALMAYTAFVAVLLGIGRLLLPQLLERDSQRGEFWILSLVFATQILTSLPLIFAALLPRWAIPSILVGLLLLAAGTVLEIWIAGNLPGWNRRSDQWVVVCINITGALWTLVTAAIVRCSGYHFGVPLHLSSSCELSPP